MNALFRFLALGAACFIGWRWLPAPHREGHAPACPFSVSWLAARHGRAEAGLSNLGAGEDDQNRLLTTALAMGIAADDIVVQRRLKETGQALGLDADAATAIGLAQGDPIIARRLVQQMRLELARRARRTEPTDADLRAYLARHADRFTLPERLRLAQVFVSPARRGVHAGRDATALLDTLAAGADAGSPAGDPFLWPTELPLQSVVELERIFGGATGAIAAAPLDEWAGPYRSALGYHLVRVRERAAARVPPFDTIRSALRLAWLNDRVERHIESCACS